MDDVQSKKTIGHGILDKALSGAISACLGSIHSVLCRCSASARRGGKESN